MHLKWKEGRLSARLMADIGKQDIVRLIGNMNEHFRTEISSWAPCIRTGVDGDLNQLKLTALSAELPGCIGAFAKGELTHLDRWSGNAEDITLGNGSGEYGFLSVCWRSCHPDGTRLEGKFTMSVPKWVQIFLLKEPDARILAVIDTIPITVYNDSISIADDFKMEHAARIYAKYDLSREQWSRYLLSTIWTCTDSAARLTLCSICTFGGQRRRTGLHVPRTTFQCPAKLLTVSITAIISCRASNSRPDSKTYHQ